MREGVTIYFVRHGETDWNAELRYQGQADVPLNAKGRAQAKRNGEALRRLLPEVPAVDFVASPLQRSCETMAIVRHALGVPPDDFRIDDRLKEVHYGHWQGSLAADLPAIDPGSLAERARDPFRWRPSGGESYADLMVRTTNWLSGVTRDTVAVSHGGVGRTLRGEILKLDATLIPFLDIPQDRVLILKCGEIAWL